MNIQEDDELLCFRASDDMKSHMVAVDTMEQFQKELDQGRVSNHLHSVQ